MTIEQQTVEVTDRRELKVAVEVRVASAVPDATVLMPQLGLAKSAREVADWYRHDRLQYRSVTASKKPVGEIIDTLTSYSASILPPRSAHQGGIWDALSVGGGGWVGFHRVPTELGIGYPLLFDFNQTPDASLRTGDTLNNPGTIRDRGRIVDLNLMTYDGNRFNAVDRTQSYFAPLVATEVEGQTVAINEVHRERNNFPGTRYVSDLLLDRWSDVDSMFRAVFHQASLDDSPSDRAKVVTLAVDRWVSQSAHETRVPFGVDGDRIIHGGARYTYDEFLLLMKRGIEIAARPSDMPAAIKDLPQGFPFMSKEMLMVTMAMLDADKVNPTSNDVDINPHLHWGGYQMAGMGSNVKGYAADSASACQAIARTINLGLKNMGNNMPFNKPLAYTMLPASMFLLMPHASERSEVVAVDGLLNETRAVFDSKSTNKYGVADRIRPVVNDWLDRVWSSQLSPAFQSRFDDQVHPMRVVPPDPTLQLLDSMRMLTVEQAVGVTGAIKTIVSERNKNGEQDD